MSDNRMFIPRRMHRSRAFRELTTSSTLVLFELLYRRQMVKIKGRWSIKNNGELVLTYAEIQKRFGLARSTIRNSIDQLVKLGFVDISHHGGGMMKDCSKYGTSERWQDYGKEEFIKKSRKKDNRKLGFNKDYWEKQTGRKRKKKSKISITNNTRSGITGDTYKYKNPKNPITSSTNHATHKTDPNYYIEKGLEVLEAMDPTQYH
jgi:hypothetical protein